MPSPLLLTDIIEAGDSDKADLYRLKTDNSSVADFSDSLEQQIDAAIDNALPKIKQQLKQELLAALSEK